MFNFHIHNFRSFQDQDFDWSRINILIGENSGGKSSLLKLLLSLKQTIDNPNEVNLKLNGDFTNLGNFEEVVYLKKKTKKIKIGFSNKKGYFDYFIDNFAHLLSQSSKRVASKIEHILNTLQDSETFIDFEFSSKLDDHSTILTEIQNSTLGSLEIVQKKRKDDTKRHNLSCDIKYVFKDGEEGVIENCEASKEGFLTLLTMDLRNKCEEHFKERGEIVFSKLAYMLIFQNYIESQIEKIRFVNPIGTSPKRFYFQEDKKASYKSIDIEKFINIIGDSSLSQKAQNERIDLLNKIIKELGIADEIQVIKDKALPVLALNIKTKGFWSNITDVGYGVSLQIPIFFQAILSEHYTEHGETILIEQPEVHLHLSLQARFIETLLKIGKKNTYFIETHSEHIIRKLQVLVKNNSLKPEEVTIHYFKREKDKFDISKHCITELGQLQPNFPAGFFDTSFNLVKELL